jgi:type IV secretion system protein VirB9
VAEPAKPQITPATVQAVEANRQWTGAAAAPIATTDGRALYIYGSGLPTVVCAPLRLSVIELQPGEKLSGKPQIGDSTRWSVSPGEYGTGAEAVTVLIVKALALNLDTILAIATDRRMYYVRLVSKEDGYLSRIGFQYSDEDNQKWALFAADQKRQAETREVQAKVLPAMITAEQLNFGYSISGLAPFAPTRVYDDGTKTFLQMPPGMQHRTAPALEVLGGDGKSEMTNYRVQNNVYIVDRLFENARLVMGAGKKAQKVDIARVQPQ